MITVRRRCSFRSVQEIMAVVPFGFVQITIKPGG